MGVGGDLHPVPCSLPHPPHQAGQVVVVGVRVTQEQDLQTAVVLTFETHHHLFVLLCQSFGAGGGEALARALVRAHREAWQGQTSYSLMNVSSQQTRVNYPLQHTRPHSGPSPPPLSAAPPPHPPWNIAKTLLCKNSFLNY